MGAVLCIHPFAEELNRSRHLAALQARALAQAGFVALQIDLGGCGDSSGDFGSASWPMWIEDATLALGWLQTKMQADIDAGLAPAKTRQNLWLWGVRGGCLLAAEVARRSSVMPLNCLFWQPVTSGQQHLTQFLRLGFAVDLVHGRKKGGTEALMAQLQAGRSIEVAGYTVSPGLAHGLAAAHLDLDGLGARVRQIICFELVQQEASTSAPDSGDGIDGAAAAAADISPGLAAQVKRWKLQGFDAQAHVVFGAPFWQNPEAPLSLALIQASTLALQAALADVSDSTQ